MLRFVEMLLRPFDNEDRELILRFRLWKSDWFPYRTYVMGDEKEFLDMLDGKIQPKWQWNRPCRWIR